MRFCIRQYSWLTFIVSVPHATSLKERILLAPFTPLTYIAGQLLHRTTQPIFGDEEMSRERLIDRISPETDRIMVEEDWTWLMSPFIDVLEMSSEAAADAGCYTEVESHVPRQDVIDVPSLKLSNNSQDQRFNIVTLDTAGKAVLLEGEPGCGKTTWILRFFSHRKATQKDIYFFRLDGLKVRSALNSELPETYIPYQLCEGIIDEMKATAKTNSIATPIDDVDPVEANPRRLERAIEETASILAKHNIFGWVILDNFDQQPNHLQRLAVDYARSLHGKGLKVLVALRPYSDRVIAAHHEFRRVTVPAPELSLILEQRVRVALMTSSAKQLLAKLANTPAELSWTQGVVNNAASLRRVWDLAARMLKDLTGFRTFLWQIHCGDLHHILHDLSEMLRSGFFANEAKRRLSGDDKRNQHEFLTAYYSGDYRHHRFAPRSGENIVNLYQAPQSDRKHELLNMRFMQFLRKCCIGQRSVSFDTLRGQLVSFGYEDFHISNTARFLLQQRLVLEVRRQLDWTSEEIAFNDDDGFTISSAGLYYLDTLTLEIRYIVAMSHVTFMDPTSIDVMHISERSVEDHFTNAWVLMHHVGGVLHDELERLRDEGKLSTFLEAIELGSGFFYPGVESCYSRARALNLRGYISRDHVERWAKLMEIAENIRDLKVNGNSELRDIPFIGDLT
jgi:hypothetical protein